MRILNYLFAILFATVLSCTGSPVQDSDPTVWNFPPTDSVSFSRNNGGYEFIVDQVVLGQTETTVRMKVCGYSDRLFTFAPRTTLKADGRSYKMLSVDGVTPGVFTTIGKSKIHPVTFHFEPLPADANTFDLLEAEGDPRAFNIYGIHRYDPGVLKLAGTNWRSERTGDWVISFMDDYVIYGQKLWQYDDKLQDNCASAQIIRMSCDGEQATVKIGAMKNGFRRIKVDIPGASMSYKCSLLESRNIADFPVKSRHNFKLTDYGYEKIDSVTISGVLIGPDRSDATFTVDVIDAVQGENPKYAFKSDERGYFTVTFPLANTSDAMFRQSNGSAPVSLFVEPGQSYFVYQDEYKDRIYVMGRKSRLQNEIQAFYHEVFSYPDRIDESPFANDLDGYLAYVIDWREKIFAQLDSILDAHPSLSEAFVDMAHTVCNINAYQEIGQSRFLNTENMYVLPDNMLDFICRDMKVNSIKPYSLVYSFNYFLRDFHQGLTQKAQAHLAVTASTIINYAIDNHLLDLTADEEKDLRWYAQFDEQARTLSEKFQNDIQRLSDTLSALYAGQEKELERVYKMGQEKGMWDYVNDYARVKLLSVRFETLTHKLDSMELEKSFKDMVITHFFINEMTNERHSVKPEMIAAFDSIVTYKPCQDAVHAMNYKYLELEGVDLASLGNQVSADELAQMSDGQAILRKITEPYRGKIIYIDVWGSWCHPCMENLANAGELKKALKDYDIVYLYLANNTAQDVWKTIIKEYNLAGPDCVHYNLPPDQQAMVEQYLKVEGYPTYRVLNRHGALMDGSYSPLNLQALKKLLDKL
ncbi:MAG: hypothetical protein IKX55_08750 [Bacteroidaceae bacterium]|nr:hypothetical protein [Bacteroidaceae bacterium]